MVSKKNNHSCEGRIEKSVPQDPILASLGKPPDAERWSSGGIFYLSYPHTHDRFLFELCVMNRKRFLDITYISAITELYYLCLKLKVKTKTSS